MILQFVFGNDDALGECYALPTSSAYSHRGVTGGPIQGFDGLPVTDPALLPNTFSNHAHRNLEHHLTTEKR